jgi:hypothetical protein
MDSPVVELRRLNIEDKKIEHQIEMENEELNNQLKTCCDTTSDRRLLMFIASFSVSLIVISFSITQLAINDSCEAQSTYLGLLTLVLGIWLKSPVG